MINGTGADISKAALDVAKENAKRLGAGCTFIQSDLYENIHEQYDVVVSNPPYIRSDEMNGLQVQIKDHEPRLALDGGTDGLDYYRRIITDAKAYLKENGWLCLEIGCDQAEAVSTLLSENAYGNIEVIQDLAGLDRAILAQRDLPSAELSDEPVSEENYV